VILLLLRSGLSCGGRSPVDNIACGLVAGIWYNVACRLTCSSCCCIYFFLMTRSTCGVSIFALNTLLIYLARLRRYICGDHQDLSVWDLKHLTRIIGGDGHTSNLKREVVRRRLTVGLEAMSREKRSSELLEHTALASRVFGVLVDRARVIVVTPAVSTVWSLGSRFDLDLALHVARCYMSCVPQTKRHARWRSGDHARALGAFTDLDRVEEHVFDAIKPRD
jgi:hypothetical protein